MEILKTLWTLITTGAPEALASVLFAAVIYLLWERNQMSRLMQFYQNKVDKMQSDHIKDIENIIEKYYKGNIELVQALNEVKLVLAVMKK